MKLNTKFSVGFIILIIMLSVWAFITTINITSDFDAKIDENSLSKEEIKIEELVITETQEGKKYWEVYAKSGFYDSSNDKILLENIIGNFYKEGHVVMSFEAPEGEYIDKKREIKLSGGAKVISEDHTQINANELLWMGKIDEVQASGDVKIVKSTEFITYSDKAIFSTDFTKFEISGNSKTDVYKAN